MIDAVLSYHLNPNTCGVARFNQALAKKLGVPCLSMYRMCSEAKARHPLVSIKPSEMDGHGVALPWWIESHSVLLHDRTLDPSEPLIRKASRVFYADELGCPSTLDGNPTRGSYRVLVFGMANKILLPHFENLKRELDTEHPDYTIELSTAVHEGSPWDEALTQSAESMRRIFGDKLRVLGFLADDALVKELQDVDAVAAYYDPAVRANNTTAWAALAAGKKLYTNTDAQSPSVAPTWESVIQQLQGARVEA